MSKKRSVPTARQSTMLPAVLVSVVLAFVGLAYFAGSYKMFTVLAAVCAVYLLLRRDLTPLRSIPAILLLVYVIVSGLTNFWAISGKFFLTEYSEIFVAAVMFLAVMLTPNFDRNTVRRIMVVLVGVSTIYCVLSVEVAATGVSRSILNALFPGMEGTGMGFETGTRLTGVLGNANILSSVVALGIIFSICLLCGEENPKSRAIYAGAAAVNAFVFLLLFSMGGTACFVLSVLVYLIFAGKNRGSALVRMLEVALPALVWVFVAFPFFNRSGGVVVIPLVAMVGCVVTVVVLEKTLAPRLVPVLAQRGKLALGVLVGVTLVAVVYVVAGYNLSGPYTFGGALERSAYPEGGQQTLSIQADGDVKVTIVSQNMSEVMMHTNTLIYKGDADGAVFTVPEDSEVCYFTFSAGDGVTLESAQLSSGESLRLKYTILPGFIANRLQGLWANQNAIQRTVFFQDGMEMFYNSPLVGNGVGSFETGATSVQDFFYETKYIHNHYIQVLLESGILGFIPFLGALLTMAWMLLKRRKDEAWEFGMEYPALWGALVMTAAHMAVEVSMSIIVFIWMAYVVFGLVVRCCQQLPKSAPAVQGAKRKERTVRLVCAALPVVFLVSLCCNIAAGSIARGRHSSLDDYLNDLALSARLDPYEYNDAKLSYVMNAQTDGQIQRANEYAQELLAQQSNSIPLALLQYYLQTEQYDMVGDALEAATIYSASNPRTWNNMILVLRSVLLDGGVFSPLVIAEDNQLLMESCLEYYALLQQRNADSMDAVELDVSSMDFFGKILSLAHTNLSQEQAVPILFNHIFNSAGSVVCDADQNYIPDQMEVLSGVRFDSEGEMTFEANGQLKLTVLEQEQGSIAKLTVVCDDPAAIAVYSGSNQLPGTVNGGQAEFEFPLMQGKESELELTISSASAQNVSAVTVMAE